MAEGSYVAYYRVSTDRQGRSGLGLEAQRAAVADHLNGGDWKLAAEFTECESGKRDDRPALALALAACRRHKATLIVAKLDRLSLSLIVRLHKSKVAFCAADNPHATLSTVNILAAVAQWEREQISERTSGALQAAKARGKQLGLSSPKRVDAKQVSALGVAAFRKNADHRARNLIPVIRTIQASGATTFRAIAEALNTRGVQAARGGYWHPTAVRNLLLRQPAALWGSAMLGNVPQKPRQSSGATRPRNALEPSPEEMAKLHEEIAKLNDEVMARMQNQYQTIVKLMGEKQANWQLKALTKKPRGHPKGSTKPEQDKSLLTLYDRLVQRPDPPDSIKSLPRRIGLFFDDTKTGEYGNSAKAIEARLRRLLDQRKVRQLKLREEAAKRPRSDRTEIC